MQIANQVVLITGASQGIGAACAREFRARGARLSLTARSEDRLRQVAGSDAAVTAGDLADARVRREAVRRTLDQFGRIDILINNAGAGLYESAHLTPMDEARRMWDLNFFAALDLVQLVVPHMKIQRHGAIVNLSSIGGKVTLPWFTLYSASKYAIGSLTDGLRMELANHGIHAMVVCPGYVRTGFQRNVLAGAPPPLTGLREKWAITPEKCARDIAGGLERNARTIVTPRIGWLFVAAARLFPALVERQLMRFRRGQEARP